MSSIEQKVENWAIENPIEFVLADEKLFKELWEHLSRPQTKEDGNCPFCSENPCDHWNGLGWTNPEMKGE